jgi:DNA-directed RNA polymerase specialized sigma subunit
MDMEAYNAWKKNPSQVNLRNAIAGMNDEISMAVKMYVGADDKAAKSAAKVLISNALMSYDPSKGTKLRTHLLTQMQPLRRFAAKRRFPVNVPEQVQRDSFGLPAAVADLSYELGRDPTDEELADHTGLSTRRLKLLRSKYGNAFSTVSEGSRKDLTGAPVQEVVSVPSKMDEWADYVYSDLTPTDKKIFEWRTGYGGNTTLKNQDIAKKLGITPGAISQRVDAITKKIDEGYKFNG